MMEFRNVAGQKEVTRMGCAKKTEADTKSKHCTSLDPYEYAYSCYCTESHCPMAPPGAPRAMEKNNIPILWGIRQLKFHLEGLIKKMD